MSVSSNVAKQVRSEIAKRHRMEEAELRRTIHEYHNPNLPDRPAALSWTLEAPSLVDDRPTKRQRV